MKPLYSPWAMMALCGLLTGCDRNPLFNDLTEVQANEVQAALLAAGLDAQKDASNKGKDWAITVPREEIPRAMSVLEAEGLPRPPLQTLQDVFPSGGLVSSPLEERARYVFALSQELEHTLMQLDGVVGARVHVAMPERTVLDDKPPSASASVVIIERPGSNLEARETDIKAIVTDGVEGLSDINRVTVKFFTRRGMDAQRVAQAAPPSAANASWRLVLAGAAALLVGGFTSGAGLRILWPSSTKRTGKTRE